MSLERRLNSFMMADGADMSAKCVTVRHGKASDCKNILQLIKELAVYEMCPDNVVITEDTLLKDGFGKIPCFRTFVAVIAGKEKTGEEEEGGEEKLVGYAFYFPTYSTWEGRTMKIEDLYVKPEFRKKGTGSLLIKSVTKEALEEGCVRVHWNVLEWNTMAIEFYKTIKAPIQDEWRVCYLPKPEMECLVQENS